jgi:signal transduction histidine kinase
VLDEIERIRLLIGSMMQAVTVPNENGDPPWVARELLRELESYAAPALREKRLRLEAICASDVPAMVAARESLKQALIILLDNAIAFSPEGGAVSIVCALRPEESTVAFAVTDEGPGVPPENRRKIFDPFFSTRTGGIGIGLFVAQSVARAQGGTLDLSDREPRGTVFTLTLPAA